MKKIVKWATPVLLAGSLLAAGCSSSTSSSGSGAKSSEPIRIGMITALTGEYNLVGNYLINGADMAVKEINEKGGVNGRKFEIVKEDSANQNPTAVNAFNKMINSDNVVAILGPDLSTQLFAVEPAVNKAKVPVLIQGSNPKLTKDSTWYFRLRPDDSLAAQSAASFAVDKLKVTKVGITHDTDEFGSGGAKIIEDALTKAGVTPVGIEAYNSSDKDLSAQLMNLKKKGAEAIIDWGHPQQSATLMKQNKELGTNIKIIGSAGMAMPATTKLAGDSVKDVYVVSDTVPTISPDQKVKDWVAKYQQAYKDAPDFHSASAYDGVYMLAEALKNSKDTSAQTIADALHKVKYQGIANEFDYSKGGDGAGQVVIVQLEDPTHMKLIDTIKAK